MCNNKKTYYVTMTDRKMSGWGCAEGRIAKRVVICDTYNQAQIIVDGIRNCRDNNGMRYVNIRTTEPNYPASKYHTTVVGYADCPLFIRQSHIRLED